MPSPRCTYLGELKYLWHDWRTRRLAAADGPAREQPVWFRWQLLEWPTPTAAVERMGLAH